MRNPETAKKLFWIFLEFFGHDVEYRAVDPDPYPRGDALVIAVARASGEGRQRASNTGGKRAQLLGGV